jgi:hypothetical protein
MPAQKYFFILLCLFVFQLTITISQSKKPNYLHKTLTVVVDSIVASGLLATHVKLSVSLTSSSSRMLRPIGKGDLSSEPAKVKSSDDAVEVTSTLEGPVMKTSGLLVLRHCTEGIGDPTATQVTFRLPPRSTSSTAGGGIVNCGGTRRTGKIISEKGVRFVSKTFQ